MHRSPPSALRHPLLAALGLALVWLALLTPASDALPAPVPPRNCAFMTVESQRYNIRSDQLRCRPARRYAKAYLRSGKKPKGWRCTNYGRETAIDFRCSRGEAVFFAIRR